MFGRKGQPKVDRDPREPGRLRRAGTRYMQSRVTFVGSAVLVLVLLAGAIYLVVVPAPPPVAGSATGPDEAVVEPTVIEPAPPPPAAVLCSEQQAAEVMPESLLSTTYATTWVADDGAAVPESETTRPTFSEWPRQCFPRTPEGALYSVATLLNEANAATPQMQLPLAEARFSRTGGYQRQVAELRATGGSVIEGTRPQMAIIGYRWMGFTPATATLEMLWVYLSGPLADTTKGVTYQLQWESNDWLMVVPSNRSALYRDGAETRTFTPWGPA